MKKILQDLKNGDIIIQDVPKPKIKSNHLIIKTNASLISIGTEKTLLSFGRSNYLDKARQQPEKVQQVINKIRVDGLKETLSSVKSKLDTPLPLGYCNVGVVEEVGDNITEFKIGDRVASNGSHSEFVLVSQNLCEKIPNNVTDEEALFTVPGSIALQGIRLCKTEIGDTIVVYGLGLLGLLAIQILKADGCNVIGIDKSAEKVKLGNDLGIKCVQSFSDLQSLVNKATLSMGADKVLITASTKSNQLLHEAATISRKRGKIVLVGIIGREFNRSDFYEKELEFQVSCSYGAGRYDKLYEDQAIDYPYAYVRWTEKRNFNTILRLLGNKSISVDKMLSSSVELSNAGDMYDKILNDSSLIGIKINYSNDPTRKTKIIFNSKFKSSNKISVGFIGAGNFTNGVLLPKIKNLSKEFDIDLNTIVSQEGLSSTNLAKKFNFNASSTNIRDVIDNDDINTIFITTQSDTHADLVIQALKNSKNVFVEKPLCINNSQLKEIKQTLINNNSSRLMVGFNRRFSKHIEFIKTNLNKHSSKCLSILVNAGSLPYDHWHHDINVGGGRLIHEGVHFIDLANYLIGEQVSNVFTSSILDDKTNDKFTINLSYSDGSIASIHYWANGNSRFPKEKITIFDEGNILECNNFKSSKIIFPKKTLKKSYWSQDKGHEKLYKKFFESITNNSELPISIDSQINSTYISFLANESFMSSIIIQVSDTK